MSKARDYLDSSFETIALLMEENKHQKTIIRALNDTKKKLELQLSNINNNNNTNNVNNDNDDNTEAKRDTIPDIDKELLAKIKVIEDELNQKMQLISTLENANRVLEETIALKDEQLKSFKNNSNINDETNNNNKINNNNNKVNDGLLEENRKLKGENEMLKEEQTTELKKI